MNWLRKLFTRKEEQPLVTNLNTTTRNTWLIQRERAKRSTNIEIKVTEASPELGGWVVVADSQYYIDNDLLGKIERIRLDGLKELKVSCEGFEIQDLILTFMMNKKEE